MDRESLWEKLGRGVAHGWEKAKELGREFSQGAESELDVALRDLDSKYLQLGKLAALEIIDAGKEAYEPDSAEAKGLLEEIRKARLEVDRLRSEGEARDAALRASQDAAGEAVPDDSNVPETERPGRGTDPGVAPDEPLGPFPSPPPDVRP
jgi:hypothetical protein